MQQEQKISIPTIEGTKKQWEVLGDNYSSMDSCPQTFFYTLTNMLKLQTAQKVLQIACGSGKLLPMILDLKGSNTEYYATDISQKMLDILKQRLKIHFEKYQSKLTFQNWMEKMKLKIKLMNGQEQFASQITDQNSQDLRKFDRIIANLVLMLTPNPEKMLQNLAKHAKKGCLFGLTVWGNKQKNNVHTILPQLSKQYGFPQGSKSRSNFHLYKKVAQIAEKYGWQLVLNWEQYGIFPFLNAQQIRPYGRLCTSRMTHLSQEQQKKLEDGFINKINEILQQKKSLEFPGQCYILRKI